MSNLQIHREIRRGLGPISPLTSSFEFGSSLASLHSDQESGVRPVSLGEERDENLHRCDRGSVSILVLFMGLIIFALAAMVWNTGKITTSAIEAQTAADTAAYTSAVWTSRAVNMIAATNMHGLRDASAIGVSTAVIFEGAWILTFQTIFLVGTVIPQLTNPFTLASGLAALAVWLAEFIQWIIFVVETGWPVFPIIDIVNLAKHLGEVLSYQQAWVAAVPGLIETQRQQIADYYDCDISLQLGNGSTSIAPPLHRGTPLTCLVPIGLRYIYDAFAEGSWYSDTKIKTTIKIGKAKVGWLIGGLLGAVAAIPALGFTHHVLSSQPGFSPLEIGPFGFGFSIDPATWDDYSVIAVARKRTTNAASKQFPDQPLAFMAPGLFTRSDQLRPAAYSQAETFNAIDGLLPTLKIGGVAPFQIISSIYPWRVWTDWGWQWQPRLTHGANLPNTVFANQGIQLTSFGQSAAQH